jgi:hypothetical protein
MDSLLAKTDTIVQLEGRLGQLTTSLQTASEDAEAKRAEIKELEEAKLQSEQELKDLKDALEKSVAQGESNDALLRNVRQEVCHVVHCFAFGFYLRFLIVGRGKGHWRRAERARSRSSSPDQLARGPGFRCKTESRLHSCFQRLRSSRSRD